MPDVTGKLPQIVGEARAQMRVDIGLDPPPAAPKVIAFPRRPAALADPISVAIGLAEDAISAAVCSIMERTGLDFTAALGVVAGEAVRRYAVVTSQKEAMQMADCFSAPPPEGFAS